jgi:mono/diheme cytochrome c family protein
VGVAAVLAGFAAWVFCHRPAQAQVNRKALRPGLVATHRDAKPGGAEVVQLEPAIALALKADEAAHPRLAAPAGTVRWDGFLNVLRAGEYQFSAVLRGKFRLTIAGKVVLDAEARADEPASALGPAMRLEAGIHPLAAEFTRLPGAARLDVSWKAPHFHREPLPHSALSHLPAKAPPALAANREQERGRFLVEELSCAGCHRPDDRDRLAKGLQSRQGPDLSAVGGRVRAGWIYHWLTAAPGEHAWRVMPHLFADSAAGRAEAYAVTRYLASLGGPLRPAGQPPLKQLRASVARGERLFTVTGCVVCHHDRRAEPGAKSGAPALIFGLAGAGPRNYPLSGLASKTTPDKLAAYLANPLAVDPSGRMPHMLLSDKEARDLANYLCAGKDAGPLRELPEEPALAQRVAAFRRVDPRPEELAAFRKLPAERQWLDLGKRLVIEKGCNNCHTIAPGGQPFANVFAEASFVDIRKAETHQRGCLAAEEARRGKAPLFALAEAERAPIRAFLKEGARGAGSPSPMHAARVALQRFNCLACHARDGEGGLTPELVQELRRYEKAEDAEAFTPPPLTGVGHKLLTPWLRQVLTEASRARPWMGLRMPQFGPAHVGHLPEALAALDGERPQDKPNRVALSAAKIKVGRDLVGKAALGCISCHDLAGIPNPGTRGPDLALSSGRLRYPWYRRWLESAQRMQPGTKMPTVFPDGKSLLDHILKGNADAQAEAMWAYLSLGPTLPLPEGLEPLKGLVVAVKDRPVLLRTFLPGAGTRAVAVGYPGGVSVAFDGSTCRLAYGWAGNFLDPAPVWDNRGGAPAKVLGPRFWEAPPGCPWGVNDSQTPPDFAARARDPAFGGPLPEGKVFTGRRELFFDGYSLDRDGLPTFRYHLEPEFGKRVAIEERPEPLRGPAGVGVARCFQVQAPARKTLWLLAGESAQLPRTLDAKGEATPLTGAGNTMEIPAAGRRLVLSQGGPRVTVLAPAALPRGAVWHLRREGSAWKVLLRLPGGGAAARYDVRLDVWSPWRDDPALLRELGSQK